MYDKTALEIQLLIKKRTKKQLAEAADVTQQTMLRHFTNGNFTLREVECICRELGITDPRPIFFSTLVT